MKARRIVSAFVLCMLLVTPLSIPVNAAMASGCAETVSAQEVVKPRATETFSMSIPGKTKATAGDAMSLVEGESVTIKAYYSPVNASVDIGLVGPDGVFRGFNTTGGEFDETISITKSGQYTLKIRNNSTGAIDITGQVNY